MESATFAAGSFERVEETFRRIESAQQTIGNDQMWAGQYRSAIFFHSLEQEATAHASKKRLRQQVHAADGYRDSARNPVLSSGKIPPASHREAGRCGLSGMRW